MDPKPDIIVLTHTWHCKSTEFFEIDGYQGFMSSIYLKKFSGVAILARNEFNVVKHSFQPHLCFDNLSIELETDIGRVSLTGVYNSPQNSCKTLLDEFETFKKSIKSKSSKVVMGFFNFDTLCKNSISKNFKNLLLSTDM